MCVGQVFFGLLTIHSHYDYCRIWLWILLILQTISIYNYRLPMKVMLLVVAVCLSTRRGDSMYMPPTWLPPICTGPQPLPNTDRVPAPASRRVQLPPHLAPTP